jgi:predicted Ser/Thr protein kinase
VSGSVTPGVGETFGGYTIESLLGRGGMGTVYLATHERLARKVALKVIAPDLAHDEDFRVRFLRESQLAASLDHPNVISIYDADEVDGVLYLAMRYVNGPSLQALLRERGRLSPEETLRIAEQVGGALDEAHRAGLVHRDVKPANILLAEPRGDAYLCDFGLAKRTSSKGVTQTGSFLGTVDYSAPEQIQGGQLDGRADVYSLGCVLYHCLVGQPPYTRDTEFAVLQAHLVDPPPSLAGVRPGLGSSLDEVIAKAMAKDAAGRYPTAGALAAALREALAEPAAPTDADATRAAPPAAVSPKSVETAAPVTELDETRVATGRSHFRGRPGWLIGALILVVALVAASVVLATRGLHDGASTAGPADVALGTFVDRIENVLEQSAAGRDEIGAALAAGFDCSISRDEARQRIDSVADNRQSILGQLGSMQAPTQEADHVVTLLQRALQQSIEADRHYRDGFATADANAVCPVPVNRNFRLAAESDRRATAAKERFVAAFDPLAERLGRRAWSAGEI